MIFAKAIAFHPFLMAITTSIFFGNFKLSLGIFQNKFKFWFLVNLHHSLEHYEAWKDEEPFWSKTEILLPKNCKISFLPLFWAMLWLYQQFYCKIYTWRRWDPKFIFSLLQKSLVYSDKKKSNSKNFDHVGFCAPEMSTNF